MEDCKIARNIEDFELHFFIDFSEKFKEYQEKIKNIKFDDKLIKLLKNYWNLDEYFCECLPLKIIDKIEDEAIGVCYKEDNYSFDFLIIKNGSSLKIGDTILYNKGNDWIKIDEKEFFAEDFKELDFLKKCEIPFYYKIEIPKKELLERKDIQEINKKIIKDFEIAKQKSEKEKEKEEKEKQRRLKKDKKFSEFKNNSVFENENISIVKDRLFLKNKGKKCEEFIFQKNVNELFSYDEIIEELGNSYTKKIMEKRTELAMLFCEKELDFEMVINPNLSKLIVKMSERKINDVNVAKNNFKKIIKQFSDNGSMSKEQIELYNKLPLIAIKLLDEKEINMSINGEELKIPFKISVITKNLFKIEIFGKEKTLDWKTIKTFVRESKRYYYCDYATLFNFAIVCGCSKQEFLEYIRKLLLLKRLK